MTDIPALKGLLEKVEAASGPDREIDWEIRRQFYPDEVPFVLARYEEQKAACKANGLWPSRKDACWRDASGGTRRYTVSVDDAISLATKLGCYLHAWEEGRWFIRRPIGGGGERQFGGPPHTNMALALCAALLRAKIAEAERSQ